VDHHIAALRGREQLLDRLDLAAPPIEAEHPAIDQLGR
jgi:hypothetical protein